MEDAGEELLENANKARIEIKAIVEQCQREVEKVLEKYNDSCLLMKDYGNGEWGVGDTVIANYEIVPVSQFPVHCYAELGEVIRSVQNL